MYSFSEKNIQLSNWLFFDAVLDRESIGHDSESGTFKFEVQRVDWENINQINYFLYKSLRVYSYKSKVLISNVDTYKWLDEKNIHQDYSIRSIDFDTQKKVLNILTLDGELDIETHNTFKLEVKDIEPILEKPFLRIVNGTTEGYSEWLEEYKRSIYKNT